MLLEIHQVEQAFSLSHALQRGLLRLLNAGGNREQRLELVLARDHDAVVVANQYVAGFTVTRRTGCSAGSGGSS